MSEQIDFYAPAWAQEAPDKAVEAVRALLLKRSQVGLNWLERELDDGK